MHRVQRCGLLLPMFCEQFWGTEALCDAAFYQNSLTTYFVVETFSVGLLKAKVSVEYVCLALCLK